ncbi:rad50 [Tribolium castaneum]|uniref:DNA repair protein RAD50 n=1 Tax=Tribolium castaneum TaxID=7070 RepID=D2A5X5_TRICA|nr:PREDICTED: DNA repair protein RAD50 [Tribolium castaneum]EFA05681.1 rad50 [Tribolium castaneum]|eukprot:XP_969783.1 PREDICTED: DNA repair protein RAD50 [Tribolium castaneum]
MATLERLQISGVRSFGPNEEHCQTIKFATPLTLILGQNGSGKTTIIEAIKYVCTAELPQGTNGGQGFVNDPKMSSLTTTRGQIKLRVVDSKNNAVTISRIMELTQTAINTQRFSSKGATIRIVKPNGDDSSISGRCADITNECCQIMNVSSSILNNVVFCHQENSAWPLDEGKKVKEKFDEIFDAQQSNKCVEIYRKLLKEKQEKIKLLKLELEYKKEKKEQVDKDKRVLQDKEAKLESFDAEIAQKMTKLQPVKKRIDEIIDLEKVLSELERDLATKEATKNGLVEEQKTIKKNLAFEFEGTDQELQDKIKSFENERQKDETLIQDLVKRQNDIETKKREINEAVQKTQSDLGRLNQQKSHNLKKCCERKKLFDQALDKFRVKISNFDDNTGAKHAINQLKSALNERQDDLGTLIEEKELDLMSLQATLDDVRAKSIKTQQIISSKTREVTDCEQKIESVSLELAALASSDEFLQDYTKRLEAISKTIFNLNNSFRETEESERMEASRSQVTTLEHNLDGLEREYRILLQNDTVEGKIESERHLIMEKQREINKIKSKHAESLRELFGTQSPDCNLKDAVLAKQKSADLALQTLNEQIARKQKDVTTLEVQLQNQIERIGSCQRDLKTGREKISQVCNGRDFDEVLTRCSEKKERLQRDKGNYTSVKIIYNQYIKKFEEERPCCPVCETNFSGKTTVVGKIITTLKSKLDKVPQQLAKVETELVEEEALYNKLQQLKVVNDEITVLTREKLPELESGLNEIKRDYEAKKTDLEALKQQTCGPLKTLEISKSVISDVSTLDQNQADVDKSQKTVEKLKRELALVPSQKSKQEVEAEIDSTKAELSELRRKIEAQTKKINSHKDRLQQLTQERNALFEKQIRMKDSMQNRPNLEAQLNEANEKLQTLRGEIVAKKTELEDLEDELGKIETQKKNLVQENKTVVEKERNQVAMFGNLVHNIEKLEGEIEDYVREGVDEKLAALETTLGEFRQKEATLDHTKTKILNLLSEKREALAKHELRFRTLQSNVTLREKKVLELDLVLKIEDLRKLIGGHDYRTVYDEKCELIRQKESHEKTINSITGEKNALLETVDDLRLKLAKPDWKNAYSNYMTKLYELKLAECVVKDLFKYITVLEKAILEFHATRMKQINKTIREMWREIYRGNDVDYIEIKAEHAGSTTANRKRTYNYRVVQVKKGVELEMRGRCSAGQKVLACLIIRMALAETLSANCGILALDEPTTNLDRENIFSLCEALARIVESRQKEKNFQLVVITHDEEFINALTRAQGVPFFYRVSRNQDGFSVIKKEYAL